MRCAFGSRRCARPSPQPWTALDGSTCWSTMPQSLKPRRSTASPSSSGMTVFETNARGPFLVAREASASSACRSAAGSSTLARWAEFMPGLATPTTAPRRPPCICSPRPWPRHSRPRSASTASLPAGFRWTRMPGQQASALRGQNPHATQRDVRRMSPQPCSSSPRDPRFVTGQILAVDGGLGL